MQLVVELKKPQILNKIDDTQIAGYIVSIKELSAYNDGEYNINELEEIVSLVHQKGKAVYLNARKIFHDDDLKVAEDIISKMIDLGIDYYLYGDVGFYEMAKAKGIEKKLIYQVNTYMTNRYDIDIMLEENHGVVLSTEISYSEIENILKDVKGNLYLNAFGYYPIFHSRRRLITNYKLYRNEELDLNKTFDIVEELRDSHYPIEENSNGTVIYTDGLYYLSKEIYTLNNINQNLKYLIYSKFIKEEEYLQIITMYCDLMANKEVSFEQFNNLTKGLLYETSKLLKTEGGK